MNQGARWLIFAAGVALSIALSLLFGGFFLFLLVPLLGLPFGRSGKTCAACGAMVGFRDRFCARCGQAR